MPVASVARMKSTLAAVRAREDFSAHMALVFVQTCFGLFPIFGKRAFQAGGFSPMGVGAWRMLFGAVALSAVALLWKRSAFRAPPALLPKLVLLGFLGVAANMTLYLEGLARSTAVNTGLMVCLIPVFTVVIAMIVGQERFEWQRLAGLALALFGASLLFWAEQPELVAQHALGNLLLALNMICYAVYLVQVRPLTREHPPLVVIAWVFLASLIWLPLLFWRDLSSRASDAKLLEVFAPELGTTQLWLALGYILLFPTFFAYLLNAFALSRVRASTTAVYVYVQPLITACAAAWILGEELTRTTLFAAACIFPGVWLVSRTWKKEPTL
jgi:drug/metabolite transporter (DMT)-like permease